MNSKIYELEKIFIQDNIKLFSKRLAILSEYTITNDMSFQETLLYYNLLGELAENIRIETQNICIENNSQI